MSKTIAFRIKPCRELQEIDCNCNDCRHMVRDLEKRKKSIEFHHKIQLDYFTVLRNKLYEKAEEWRERGEPEKAKLLQDEADKMEFQFDQSEAALHYGHCQKFDKPVSFIPVTCQIETQQCFEHRKPLTP